MAWTTDLARLDDMIDTAEALRLVCGTNLADAVALGDYASGGMRVVLPQYRERVADWLDATGRADEVCVHCLDNYPHRLCVSAGIVEGFELAARR